VSLRNRIRRLETGSGPTTCPECGLGPNSPVEHEVEWEPAPTQAEIDELRRWYERGMPEEEIPEEPQDEYCPRCGRQTLYIIDWPDAPSRRELRRLEAEMLAARGWDTTFLFQPPAPMDHRQPQQKRSNRQCERRRTS
jgi:hypothetical protein